MLEMIFRASFLTSCLGGLLSFSLFLLKPITQKHFSRSWHYYIWLVVLIVMMLPVRFCLPASESREMFAAVQEWENENLHVPEWLSAERVSQIDDKGRRIYSPYLQERREWKAALERKLNELAPLWLLVAVTLLAVRFFRYAVFLRKIRKTTIYVSCPELTRFTEKKVLVRTGEWISSPQLLGVFRHTLLLPEKTLTEAQLNSVLVHEITHLRRKDLLYKWFVMLVKCFHWFNPMVYFIGRQVEQECEISCDILATAHMNQEDKMCYIDTILFFFTGRQQKECSLTTGMAGRKGLLKKRFKAMKNRVPVNKGMQVLSATVAAAFLAAAILTSGRLGMQTVTNTIINISDYTSYCHLCRKDVMFSNRSMVNRRKVDSNGNETFLGKFYIMTFKCPTCGAEWQEELEVGSSDTEADKSEGESAAK